MDKPYVIVGHGLAGCVLAMTMWRKNIPFRIIGKTMEGEASMASSGLITPVTGRKYVKSWMIEEFLSAALDFYRWSEGQLGKKYYHPVEIIRFLSHPEALAAWDKRSKDAEYHAFISKRSMDDPAQVARPYGVITGGFRLDAPSWISDVRLFLTDAGVLEENEFNPAHQNVEDNIIYATGAIGSIPSAGLIPNKGEALIVRMPEWKYTAIIKEEVFFVPLKDDLYWVGSYYLPWPEKPEASDEGRKMLLEAIERVYAGSLTIEAHLAGIRPTMDDRRPLVGPWPGQQGKYLFNGMGTKGTSLAPYWADHLVSHLINQASIRDEVHPKRYA